MQVIKISAVHMQNMQLVVGGKQGRMAVRAHTRNRDTERKAQ